MSSKRPARRSQGKPGQGRTAQGRPAQGRPAQGRPAQGRPAQGRPAQGRAAQGRPAQGRPQQGGVRPAIQRRSLTPLVYLRQLPGWAAPLVMAALLIVGLAVRGWGGAIALCLVAVFITWLGYLSWPALSVLARAGRLLVTIFVLALAFLQSTR